MLLLPGVSDGAKPKVFASGSCSARARGAADGPMPQTHVRPRLRSTFFATSTEVGTSQTMLARSRPKLGHFDRVPAEFDQS